MEKLAIHGGTPVRSTELPPWNPGAVVYNELETAAVAEVIKAKSPYRYYGPNVLYKVQEYEKNLSERLGVPYALGVSSGTAALMVALKAAGIGVGDKVIMPACTFIATPGAVICAGAVPVFCDIDDTFNMDPSTIEELIDESTKAIITVPIYGNPCRMEEIMEIANRHNIIVIEDAAQSFGGKYKGQYIGTHGHIGCFSLQLNKMITTGEGGMVVTSNQKLYERAVMYHNHGIYREVVGILNKENPEPAFVGQNYRMSEIEGAIANVQLSKLDMIIDNMRRIKHKIKSSLQGIPGLGFREITDAEGEVGSTIMFVLDSKEKSDRFREALVAENIRVAYLYNGEPIYMMPQIFHQRTAENKGFPFNQVSPPVKYTEDMCPYAQDILARNAVINISPIWSEQDVQDIIAGVKKIAAQVL